MRVVETIAGLREAVRAARSAGGPDTRIGFVPTMGALHEGHLSLVRAARSACEFVVVSIFVNPLQFGPNEDLARYPRTFAEDCRQLEQERVDLLFAPGVEEMYPPGGDTTVNVGALAERLDGASRPGHFRGVATVVAKLFNLVTPDVAYFGQKDAAQVAVLRKMVRDLNFPLRMEVGATARDPDGLALSSRNRYLSEGERRDALGLSRALSAALQAYAAGETCSDALLGAMRGVLQQVPAVRVDYVAIVDWDTLLPVETAKAGTLVAVAAWVGTTRLIDNVVL